MAKNKERIIALETKYDSIDRHLSSIDKQLSDINTKIDNNFRFMLTTMTILFITGLGISAAILKLIP